MRLVVVVDVRCSVGGDWSGEAMQRLKRQGKAKRRADGWNRCMNESGDWEQNRFICDRFDLRWRYCSEVRRRLHGVEGEADGLRS